MILNPSKCHVMFTSFQRVQPTPPTFNIGLKLLGIHVQQNLKWDTQIVSMCKTFNRKLYFLRQLKRFRIPTNDLKTLYIQYVRPALEYASPVWFSGLTKKQVECLEKLQRKAFRIILTSEYCRIHSYTDICVLLNIPPMSDRLEKVSINVGKSIINSSRYRDWLPPCRNNGLRNSNTLSTIRCRTNRYKISSIPSITKLINNNM